MRTANLPVAKKERFSKEALDLCLHSDLIDLHVDTFIPTRLFGYNPLIRNRHTLLGRHFFAHLDLPRMEDSGVTGAMWLITTNPFRSARSRWKIFQKNLLRLQNMVQNSNGKLAY